MTSYYGFENIKKIYEETGEIPKKELEEFLKIIQNVQIDTRLRSNLVDFVTDTYLDKGRYQDAHNLLQDFCRYRGKHTDTYELVLMQVKLLCVRAEALAEGVTVYLHFHKVEYNPDSYNILMSTFRNYKENYNIIVERLDDEQLKRFYEFWERIEIAKTTIEEKMKEEHTSELDTHTGDGVEIINDGDDEMGEITGSEGIQGGNVGEQTDVMLQPETEITLEEANVLLSNLEERIRSLKENSPEYLDTLLNIIELQYDKLELLKTRIKQLSTELQEFEKIFRRRQRGLELISGAEKLSDKIQKRTEEIEALSAEEKEISKKFTENKDKASEVLDRG